MFEEVATEVGLIPIQSENAWWCRHPLAFLVEAADDITYSVIDFEDGYRLNYIGFEEVINVLLNFLDKSGVEQLVKIKGEKEKIEYLRAKTINSLIFQVTRIFMEYHD